MKKRVVVTGMGCVTPLGLNHEETWNHVVQGNSGIDYLSLDPTMESLIPVKIGAEVKGFSPTQYFDSKEARRMDRFIQFAVAASLQAVVDGGLLIGKNADPARVGVWIGTGVGGVQTFESGHADALKKGYKRISPFALSMFIPNMAASQTAIKLGAQGVSSCSATACASGSNSIGEAFKVIERGDADVMIAGGTEAPICPISVASFAAMQALSVNPDPKTASRPFDRNRDGFVLGEGAGILLLESLDHAIARGATIYAELAGYGACCDAYHITAPRPGGEGWARAMELALTDAALSAEDIDYINAHGTSTVYNDLCETRAIKKVLGSWAQDVHISSTKSMTGHLLGASGAIEAIFSILSIRDEIVPPTVNYEIGEEELDLNYTPNVAHKKRIHSVMSNTFAFGGHNAVLIFQKYGG